jgi:hypothetical protein
MGFWGFGIQHYITEMNNYAKFISAYSGDVSSSCFYQYPPMIGDLQFSGFKKRSKSAKKAMMEPATDLSLKEFLDSIPERRYLSKREI